MLFNYDVLDETEKIIYALRALLLDHGYRRYRMSKFEEYDLYSRNKDFLVSDSVITFTDTNGKLMALKPDVTLSIVRNDSDETGEIRKLFYNENVYRVSKETGSFKEIMQTGLECLGDVDPGCVREVLEIASESLAVLNKEYVIAVSDLEILSAFAGEISDDPEVVESLLRCAGEKNLHGIDEVLTKNGIPCAEGSKLKALLGLFGSPENVLPRLEILMDGMDMTEFTSLKEALGGFEGTAYGANIVLDFSIIGDMNYYNGMIFKGYVEGIPNSVLSGGQYDKLMKRMGRRSRAVGFAVYLDLLERLKL